MAYPNVKLSGIEYLLVCIQSNPGRSQRYYLRRLHMYKHGVSDPHNGGTCAAYFSSPIYRGVLFEDKAPKNSRGRVWMGWKPMPHRSQMRLTPAGERRANNARKKLRLRPIPGVFF